MTVNSSVYGESKQAEMLKILDNYTQSVCTALEKLEVRVFPEYDTLYKNNVINIQVVAKQIALFEYDRAIYVGKINDLVIKKTQSRLFLYRASKSLGEMNVKGLLRDINFFLGRLQDFESLLRLRIENADKAINSLRSIQSHSEKG